MPPDRRSSFHPVIMAAADARCSHRRALAGASSFAWQALRWQSGCPHVARRWQWATPRHGTDTPGVIWFSLLLARAMPPLLEWGSWEREEASSGPLRCGFVPLVARQRSTRAPRGSGRRGRRPAPAAGEPTAATGCHATGTAALCCRRCPGRDVCTAWPAGGCPSVRDPSFRPSPRASRRPTPPLRPVQSS